MRNTLIHRMREELRLESQCLQLLKQSATIEMFVLTRPSRRGIMNT